MEELVTIDKVKVRGRTLVPGHNLVELEKSILKKGILEPLLVDHEYNLIDGYRRWRVAQDQGIKLVKVTVSDTLEDSLDYLRHMHADGRRPHPRTVYEIFTALQDQIWSRLAVIQRGRSRGESRKGLLKTERAREAVAAVLNLPSSGWLQGCVDVYRPHRINDPEIRRSLAEAARSKMDGSLWTPYQGRGFIQTRLLEKGKINTLKEQRELLDASIGPLLILGRKLETLPRELDPGLSTEDLDRWEREYNKVARTLRAVRARIREAQTR